MHSWNEYCDTVSVQEFFSIGVGFAVPSQTLLYSKIDRYLIRDGEYQHPWIGVYRHIDINPNLAEAAGLDDTRGDY